MPKRSRQAAPAAASVTASCGFPTMAATAANSSTVYTRPRRSPRSRRVRLLALVWRSASTGSPASMAMSPSVHSQLPNMAVSPAALTASIAFRRAAAGLPRSISMAARLLSALTSRAPVPADESARRAGMDARCPLKRLVRYLATLLAVAVLAACGAPPAPQATAELDCTREGYACRLADVDPVVLTRSIALGQEAQQMFLDGDDAEQVAGFLAGQDEVVYLGVADGAVVFRIEGGTPIVVNPSVDEVISEPLQGRTPPGVDPGRYEAHLNGTLGAESHLVAGGDGAKRAIVMSPYMYEFGEMDSSGYVVGLLNSHHDYSGRVDYLYNPPNDNYNIKVKDLLGLDEYEVVYLVTHGGSLCVAEKVAPQARYAPAGEAGPGDCRTDILVHPFADNAIDPEALEYVGVVVDLPERGQVTVSGSPRVVDEGPADGWFGTFTWRSVGNDGSTYELSATGLFALPDGTDPNADYLWFYWVGGDYTFTATVFDAQSCVISAEWSAPLGESLASYLKFDMTYDPPRVSAWGQSRTPDVLASVVCPDGSSYNLSIGTDKVWLYIPAKLGSEVTGDSFGGSYVETNVWTTTWTWNFQRRE